MSKADRPSVFGTVSIPAAETPAVPVKKAPARDTSGLFRTSLYVPDPVHDKLREIAFHEHVSVNDLLVEGIDKVLAARGYPATATLKGTKA